MRQREEDRKKDRVGQSEGEREREREKERKKERRANGARPCNMQMLYQIGFVKQNWPH